MHGMRTTQTARHPATLLPSQAADGLRKEELQARQRRVAAQRLAASSAAMLPKFARML